ncbi:MAG: alpha/beta hydrolase [Oscillibacter sp.]
MGKREFTIPSADGKTALHAVEWLPEGAPRAVVQISHGVSEYILRYEPFAEYLTKQGFAVIGNDHLGHGSSVAEGGARLYFGPKGSWNWVVDDLYALRCQTGKRFPGLPYFLMGHSMGSFLARTYLIRYPGTVDAAIVMGTGQMAPAIVAGGRLVAAQQARRVGETKSSPLVMQLAFGTYNKLFAPNRTAFDWLSVNGENVEAYVADPLCGENPSTGLFREMLGGMAFISKAEHLKKMNANTPILFLSGSMDPVGACGKGVEKACASFRKAGVRDVSMKLYPGLRHEILQEGCKALIYQDIAQWLESKLPVP